MARVFYQMAKTSDHQRNLQFKETDDETSSTSNQEQNKPPSDAATGSTTENASCKICGTKFAHGQTKQNHNRTKIHRVALEEFKKKKKEETGRDVGKKRDVNSIRSARECCKTKRKGGDRTN
jgi:hypothetical protein